MSTTTIDRGAMEAEQAVIGGMLIDPEAVHRVTGLLAEGDFTRAEHRRAYTAIRALVTDGHQPELLMVTDRIRRDYPREVPGELAYLGELAHHTPSAANIEAYARRVAERAAARRVQKALAEAQDALANRADLAPVLAELEAKIESVTARADGSLAWSGVVQRALEAMDEAAARVSAGGSVGVRTGIETIDERTGGLHGSRLWVIAARPSLGKTALALQWALHASQLGYRVGICSLEMSAEELGVRAMAHVSGINVTRLFNGEPGAFSGVTPYLAQLTERGIWLDDSTYPLPSIVSRITAWRREHKIDFAIVDHIGLVDVEGADSRNDALGQVTRALKKTAKRLEMPIVAISQLSRGVEKDKRRPKLSDLRDCLPVDEWVDTPTGPTQLSTRPEQIITANVGGVYQVGCSFIEKRYNRTYRVMTGFGSFSATARHRVLTGVGWKQVCDISPGRDVIACPKQLPHANRGYQPHGRLLGWLLGNGHLSGTPNLVYRKELDGEVRLAVAAFGVTVRPRSVQRSPNVVDAYLSNGVESGCLTNPLMTWIRTLGLEGKTAHEKAIPQEYLGSNDVTHRELLRGLWESDGTVTSGTAKYATCSEFLARQVKWLLHTIGVRSTVRWCDNANAGLWEVRCAKGDNERMQEICENQQRFGRLSCASDRYIDPAPAIFVELADEIYRGEHRFQRRADGTIKLISKARMEQVLSQCHIETIAASPYMTMAGMSWAAVSAIELQEHAVRVCDLRVPGTHCFVTNGLVVHNSGSIEQDADYVLMIHTDDADAAVVDVELGLVKTRTGRKGWLNRKFTFDGRVQKFIQQLGMVE